MPVTVNGISIGTGGVRISGVGVSFVGPYDAIPNITAAYGVRRLLASYTGSLLRLRRTSDNAESDFGYDANGDLDTAAIATWLTATSGYVKTWYDQSGSAADATQATTTAQPLYVASGQNSNPVVRFDGSTDRLNAGVTIATEYSVMVAQKATGQGGSNAGRLWSARGDTHLIIPRNGITNRSYFNGGSVAPGAPVTTACLFAIINDGAYLNGASDGTIITSALGTGDLVIGNRTDAARGLAGDIYEFVIASSTWGSSDRSAAFTAANAYWSLY